MSRQILIFGTAISWIVLTGCASGPVPRADIAKAELAISQAEQRRASENSAVELRMARDKLEDAREYVDDGENHLARMKAEQSTVDALLAAAKARRAQASSSVEEMETTVDALKKEIQNHEH